MAKAMAENDFYKVIEFPTSDTKNGILTMYQKSDGGLPFLVKRVLFMRGMKENDKRGGHTHHKTNQVLIALSGGCIVDLDNSTEKTQIVLDNPRKGLLLLPYVWHVMRDFRPETTLLVLADTLYDEKDYIRNYEDFIQQVKREQC